MEWSFKSKLPLVEGECTHIKSCEMYTLLRLAGTLRAWQNRYCRADYTQCERYKRSQQGREVPVNLMPNGEKLKTGA